MHIDVNERFKEKGYIFTNDLLKMSTEHLINYPAPIEIAKISAILITGPSGVGKSVYAEVFAKVWSGQNWTDNQDLKCKEAYVPFVCMKSTSADNFYRIPDLDTIVSVTGRTEKTKIIAELAQVPEKDIWAAALGVDASDLKSIKNALNTLCGIPEVPASTKYISDKLTAALNNSGTNNIGNDTTRISVFLDGVFRQAINSANSGKKVVLHIDELDKDESGFAQQAIASLLSSGMITDGTEKGTLTLNSDGCKNLMFILTQNYFGEQVVPHLQDRLPYTVNLDFTDCDTIKDILDVKLKTEYNRDMLNILMNVYNEAVENHSPICHLFGRKKPQAAEKINSIPSFRRFAYGLFIDKKLNPSPDSKTLNKRFDKIFPIVFDTADAKDNRLFRDIREQLSNSKKLYGNLFEEKAK